MGDDGEEQCVPMQMPTPEERAAVHALSYDAAVAALEAEEPIAVTVATEFILQYSEKVGALLKEGKDYLPVLTPTDATPAIEAIAMEVVQEAVEEEMDAAD